MVVELSRLGRSTAELATLSDELQERGIALRILNLGIDTGLDCDGSSTAP